MACFNFWFDSGCIFTYVKVKGIIIKGKFYSSEVRKKKNENYKKTMILI